MPDPTDVPKSVTRSRLHGLIAELLQGHIRRTYFQPWEVDLLLDIDQYEMPAGLRTRMLRRYERFAAKALVEAEHPVPIRFSDYLDQTYLGRVNCYFKDYGASANRYPRAKASAPRRSYDVET
jgi:hypothetical protein